MQQQGIATADGHIAVWVHLPRGLADVAAAEVAETGGSISEMVEAGLRWRLSRRVDKGLPDWRFLSIVAFVCFMEGISEDDLRSQNRSRQLVEARQLVVHLARQWTPMSLPEIGRFLGDRDHTTILHAEQQAKRKVKETLVFPRKVRMAEQGLSLVPTTEAAAV